ncbi:hypothetical protein SAMN06265347_11284 [Halobellus salinus]|nr:hypothetical protein SAMN06265347_11284 [Halobellus salinus]
MRLVADVVEERDRSPGAPGAGHDLVGRILSAITT